MKAKRLRHVDVHPAGHPMGSMGYEFCVRVAAVCEVYSYHLKETEGVPAAHSWLRISIVDEPQFIDVFPASSFDYIGKPMDPEILHMSHELGWEAALGWIHSAALELARRRNWDQRPLIDAYQSCLASSAGLTVSGKPKSDRSRQHKASIELRLGYGWHPIIHVEISSKNNEHPSVHDIDVATLLTIRDFKAQALQHSFWEYDEDSVARRFSFAWITNACSLEINKDGEWVELSLLKALPSPPPAFRLEDWVGANDQPAEFPEQIGPELAKARLGEVEFTTVPVEAHAVADRRAGRRDPCGSVEDLGSSTEPGTTDSQG